MPTSGSGTGTPVTSPVSTVITEQQYRRWSFDLASAWNSVGNTIGAAEISTLASDDIADYLDTYLEPTQVVAEEHRVATLARWILGKKVACYNRLALNRKRLLTDYAISVTWVHHSRCDCSTSTTTGCASVLNVRQSKVDLSDCVLSSEGCACFTTGDFVTARITYYAGFATLPNKLVRAVALLTRHMVKELVVGDGAMDDDLPWGAPQIQRSDLGLFRTYQRTPDTPFGPHYLGREVQRLCEDYKVMDVGQM